MLTLTENASTIVKYVAEQSGGDAAGLRITADPGLDGNLNVTPAAQAEPGDQVVEQEGATVFLDDQAAAILSDAVLDAGVDETGNVQFALGQQA